MANPGLTKKKTRRDGVLEIRIQQLQEQLEQFAYTPGGSETTKGINYCRYCHYARGWIAANGHGTDCLLNQEFPT